MRKVFLWTEFHKECTWTLTATPRFRREWFVYARILNYRWTRRDCAWICCDERHSVARARCRAWLLLASIRCRRYFSTCRPSSLFFLWVLEDKSGVNMNVFVFGVVFVFSRSHSMLLCQIYKCKKRHKPGDNMSIWISRHLTTMSSCPGAELFWFVPDFLQKHLWESCRAGGGRTNPCRRYAQALPRHAFANSLLMCRPFLGEGGEVSNCIALQSSIMIVGCTSVPLFWHAYDDPQNSQIRKLALLSTKHCKLSTTRA